MYDVLCAECRPFHPFEGGQCKWPAAFAQLDNCIYNCNQTLIKRHSVILEAIQNCMYNCSLTCRPMPKSAACQQRRPVRALCDV